MVFCMLLPLVVHVIPRLALGVEGYESGTSYCFNISNTSTAIVVGTLYGPCAAIIAVGLGFMLSVLRAIIRSARGQGGASKNMAMFRTPMVFVGVFLLMWLMIFFLKVNTRIQTSTSTSTSTSSTVSR
jgi:Ca2+/Na+ antiporter